MDEREKINLIIERINRIEEKLDKIISLLESLPKKYLKELVGDIH